MHANETQITTKTNISVMFSTHNYKKTQLEDLEFLKNLSKE